MNKKNKKSSFMRNIKGGCDEYRDIAKEYICPNPKGGSRKKDVQKDLLIIYLVEIVITLIL